MKKIGIIFLVMLMTLTGCANSSEKENMIDIGISQIVEYSALDENREGFIKALEEKGYVEGENISIDYQNAQGDMGTVQIISKNFASQNKDLIFAISTPSAQASYNATKEIPVIFSAVTDPIAAGIVESLEKSNTNVSGTSDALPVDKQLELINLLVPDAKKIGFIYNTSEINSEVQLQELKESAEAYEIIATGVTSTNDVDNALSSIIDKIDVLYIPTDQLIVSAMPIVAKKTLENNVPIIAAEKGSVEQGALATMGIDYYKLGYNAGMMAAKVLEGEDISTMPISTLEDTTIFINEDSLKQLNMDKPDNESVVYVKTK